MAARLRLLVLALAGALALGGGGITFADDGHDHGKKPAKAAEPAKAAHAKGHKPTDVRLMMPMMNSVRGMHLFTSKGCVACHAVNGVGGHDATALDAHTMNPMMNPFDLIAKMWRMAPAMIAAQEEAMDGQILFTGEEIGDIIAFIHDDEQQHEFTDKIITPKVRKMMDHEHGPKKPHQKEIGHED